LIPPVYARALFAIGLENAFVSETVTYKHTVKPACNGTARDMIFFYTAGSFYFIWVLEFWILGTPDPQNCKSFPLNTRSV
jgi:hypothetical protein